MGVVAVADEATVMHRLTILAIIFLFSQTPTFSLANDYIAVNGEELYGWCKRPYPNSKRKMMGHYCYGFLAGVIRDNGGKPVVPGFQCCPTRHVTAREIRNIFINWIEKRPKKWQEDAHDLVGRALSEAFPCNQ